MPEHGLEGDAMDQALRPLLAAGWVIDDADREAVWLKHPNHEVIMKLYFDDAGE